MNEMLGKVVYSKSGRDKGSCFVVVDIINEKFMVLADGDIRKIENPKIKNIKHIQVTNSRADDVVAYLDRGEVPENHVIRKSLRKIKEARESNGKEVR